MAELLFETYGAPSVGTNPSFPLIFQPCSFLIAPVPNFFSAFGIDAAFSYKYNQGLGTCKDAGIAICSGSNTSHVIPVSHDKFYWNIS